MEQRLQRVVGAVAVHEDKGEPPLFEGDAEPAHCFAGTCLQVKDLFLRQQGKLPAQDGVEPVKQTYGAANQCLFPGIGPQHRPLDRADRQAALGNPIPGPQRLPSQLLLLARQDGGYHRQHGFLNGAVEGEAIVRGVIEALLGAESEGAEVVETGVARHLLAQRQHGQVVVTQRLPDREPGGGHFLPGGGAHVVLGIGQRRRQLVEVDRLVFPGDGQAAGDIVVGVGQLVELGKQRQVLCPKERRLVAHAAHDLRQVGIADVKLQQPLAQTLLRLFQPRHHVLDQGQVGRFARLIRGVLYLGQVYPGHGFGHHAGQIGPGSDPGLDRVR